MVTNMKIAITNMPFRHICYVIQKLFKIWKHLSQKIFPNGSKIT